MDYYRGWMKSPCKPEVIEEEQETIIGIITICFIEECQETIGIFTRITTLLCRRSAIIHT